MTIPSCPHCRVQMARGNLEGCGVEQSRSASQREQNSKECGLNTGTLQADEKLGGITAVGAGVMDTLGQARAEGV